MTPIQLFESVWDRANILGVISAYLENAGTAALRPEEILRAEWVARVSALDLYVHELISQKMLAVFLGQSPTTLQFRSFKVTSETTMRIHSATTQSDAAAAFDLDVRQQLALLSFQMPDKIADGIRLVSAVELWNCVALKQGATEKTKADVAKQIKKNLSLIAERRNKIAHEGDLQPSVPRTPWPISQQDLVTVRTFIEKLVRAIDACV